MKYLSDLQSDTLLMVKQQYYDEYAVMTKEELLQDYRYQDYLRGDDAPPKIYLAGKIHASKFDFYRFLKFYYEDEIYDDNFETFFEIIGNVVDVNEIENKINKILLNFPAYDYGEEVKI